MGGVIVGKGGVITILPKLYGHCVRPSIHPHAALLLKPKGLEPSWGPQTHHAGLIHQDSISIRTQVDAS